MKLIKNFFLFQKIQNKFEVIFYSEGSHDTIYFEDLIKKLDTNYNIKILILTSNEKDICFNLNSKNVESIFIGDGFFRTLIYYLINTKLFVTSLPDLQTYFLKRSKISNTKYIYLFHAASSTNAAYNKGAFDNYDYIFCRGQHHVDEILENENLNNLKKKILFKHGCPIFDKMSVNLVKLDKKPKKILLAPSWNNKNELIDLDIENLIEILIKKDLEVTLRFHPMTLKRKKRKVDELIKKYDKLDKVDFSLSVQNKKQLYDNDILITDWSGIAQEFSIMLGKPVIFLDIPKKIMNQDYEKFLNKAVEISYRNKIGYIFKLDEFDKLANFIKNDQFLNKFNLEKIENIKKVRHEIFFNHGKSTEYASNYIKDILKNV
tara:strand:+ start:62645 stop:63772 length:1128 start_codon:yes stop_codon:yes gene_type:complete